MSSPFDVSYRGSHHFDAPPVDLWRELGRVECFERWWPWMRDVHLEGEALAPGSSISFCVDPPVRFTLRVRVDVTDSRAPDWIDGHVSGDLQGTARLELHEDGAGAVCDVSWDVEIANARIRRVIRVARPVLLWAQRWAVEIALHGFRIHLRAR